MKTFHPKESPHITIEVNGEKRCVVDRCGHCKETALIVGERMFSTRHVDEFVGWHKDCPAPRVSVGI